MFAYIGQRSIIITICIALVVLLLSFGQAKLADYLLGPRTTQKTKPVAQTPQPTQPSTDVESNDSVASTNLDAISYINPVAPCPEGQLSCHAQQYGMVLDANCPAFKPIWAYLSQDHGVTWSRVGCYATEIDASKGIDLATKWGLRNAENLAASAKTVLPETTDADPTSDAPTEPHAATIPGHSNEMDENGKEEMLKNESLLNPSEVARNSKDALSIAIEAIKSESAKNQEYTVHFKTMFGLIPLEKRTYPNAEMKRKAIELWENGHHILELDGSINDKYAAKQKESSPIPGFN
jgi:hypothetical protein